jgi:phosphoglycolate phosphatase
MRTTQTMGSLGATGVIKAVAFDCDGVMFDTTLANLAYYNRLLRQFNHPDMTPEQRTFTNMHTVHESVALLFPDPTEREAAHEYRKSMGYVPFIDQMEIEPYLKPLLQRLRPAYKTAVATNRTDTMHRVLSEHGLQGRFDQVLCAQDVAKPKPHPDMLTEVLRRFEIEPREMLYVGDSTLDEQAAKAAGIPLIAYRNQELDARFHIESLQEIKVILGL